MLSDRRSLRAAAVAVLLLVPLGVACSSDDGTARVSNTRLNRDTGASQTPGSTARTTTSLVPGGPQTNVTATTQVPTPAGASG